MADALHSVDYHPEQILNLSECLYCPRVCECVRACVSAFLVGRPSLVFILEIRIIPLKGTIIILV